ncbi:MAG: LPS export ABC transporter permease LptF [Gammaproteobacteria bacterium]|nr:LPS export ABC transporter permease LptF [Gammaproteobacteria bacterium]|tara:strand:+ start:168 stop:1253 length:1086 start_codon:yes stop_codon:yes gene_type:complete
MIRILDKYIFREIAITWFGVTLVLLLILLTNQFARILGDVAKGKLPKYAALDVVSLSIVQYLTILIPIGLFLAIMLALGRLYRDSEMPAMMACRVGLFGIYRPLFWFMTPLIACVAWLSIQGGPSAMYAVDLIGAEAKRGADLASVEPGKFTVLSPDRAVVYGRNLTTDGFLEKVFMQRQSDKGVIEIVTADMGEMIESDDPNLRLLVLHNGRRYEGIPGTTDFRIIEFKEHGIPYRLPRLEPLTKRAKSMTFSDLLGSSDLEHIAELQWRLSVPISTVILAIMAVPLSRSRPRDGKYERLAIGLLVFIIYLNLMTASKAWLEQGAISSSLGIWWVHGLMLISGFLLIGIQNGYFQRLKNE